MNPHPQPKSDRKGLRANLPLALIVVIGLALSALAFLVVRNLEESRTREVFEEAALGRFRSFERQIERALTVVQSIGAFFNSSSSVERGDFASFVSPFFKQTSGIQAFTWMPRVRVSEREEYEDAARLRFAGFEFTDRESQGSTIRAGLRPEYFPVYYLEPRQGNEVALGFDLASDALGYEAIQRARDSGEMAATSRFALVNEPKNQFSVLIIAPIYRKGAPTNTVEERRENLVGLGAGVYHASDIVEELSNEVQVENIDLDFHLYDTSAPSNSLLLFSTTATSDSPLDENGVSLDSVSLKFERTIAVAGRNWTVIATPAAGSDLPSRPMLPWGALAAGLVLTGFGAVYLRSIYRHTNQIEEANLGLKKEIAQRQQAEEKSQRLDEELARGHKDLEKAQTNLEDLMESASNPIVTVDRNGQITSWNTAATTAFGFATEEVLGESIYLVLASPQAETFRKTAQEQVLSGEVVKDYEAQRVRKDGTPVDMSITFSPIRDAEGTVVGVFSIYKDISERKRAVEKLWRAEKNFRGLMDSVPDAIVTVDNDGRIVLINKQVEKMFGYKKDELIGQTIEILVPERFREVRVEHRKGYASNPTTRPMGAGLDLAGRRKDGSEFPVEATLSSVEMEKGIHAVAIIRDITDRKKTG